VKREKFETRTLESIVFLHKTGFIAKPSTSWLGYLPKIRMVIFTQPSRTLLMLDAQGATLAGGLAQ
jgi:hypothetical protein